MSSESGSYTISYSYNNINNIKNQYAPININFNINQSNSINQGYSDENFPSITDSESITYPGIDLVFNLQISNNIPSLLTPIIIFRTQNDITSNVPTIIGGQITFSINNTYTTFIITSASFTESTSNPLITNGIYAYSYNIVGNIFNGNTTNFTNLSYFNSQLSYFNDGNQPLYQSNSNEFTSQYNDVNFPAINDTNNNISGIIINVDTSNNTFNITFNTTNFLLDNENFTDGTDMIIYFYLNNTTYGGIYIEYNTTYTNPYSNYPILYSINFKGNLQNNPYIPTPSPPPTTDFSPVASNQAATTKRQTRALLSLLDPRGKHIDYKNQEKIANESGKIAGHVVSISEGINNIGFAIAKR